MNRESYLPERCIPGYYLATLQVSYRNKAGQAPPSWALGMHAESAPYLEGKNGGADV